MDTLSVETLGSRADRKKTASAMAGSEAAPRPPRHSHPGEAATALSPGRKLISSSPALSLPVPPHPSGRFLSFPLKRSARRRSRLLCFRSSPVVACDVWDAPDSDSEPEEAMYAWKSSSSISFRESVRRVTRLRSGSSSSQVSLTFECRSA